MLASRCRRLLSPCAALQLVSGVLTSVLTSTKATLQSQYETIVAIAGLASASALQHFDWLAVTADAEAVVHGDGSHVKDARLHSERAAVELLAVHLAAQFTARDLGQNCWRNSAVELLAVHPAAQLTARDF